MANFSKSLNFFFIVFFICISFNANAEIYVKEYTHNAGDADSKISSRAIALDQVKKLLLEEIGVHVRSRFEVEKNKKGFKFAKEEIETLTAGVVSVIIIDEKWNGLKYYLKATMEADPAQVLLAINQFKQQDVSLVAQLAMEREALKNARKELEQYKKGFSSYKGDDLVQETNNYNRSVKVIRSYEYIEEGIQLYRIGNYVKAAELLHKAEALGSERASITLALMYLGGKGVKLDRDKADSLLINVKDSVINKANKEDAFYQNALGLMYYHDLGALGEDKELGLNWVKKSADHEYIPAMANMAGFYIERKQYSLAKNVYQKLIELDSPFGYSGLAWMYHKGMGVEYDPEKSFDLSLKAADMGYSESIVIIASYYLAGDFVVEKDFPKAMEMFSKAAELGANNAYAGMGDIYQGGAGVEKDLEKARDFYLKGAEYGSHVSYFRLAQMYLNGAGVIPDISKAKHWLQKSADAGNAQSKQYLLMLAK